MKTRPERGNSPERGGDILSPKPNNRGRDAHAPFQARGRDAHAPFETEAYGYLDPNADIIASRHWLPHWEQEGVCYFVTWRLADSLPQEKLATLAFAKNRWLQLHPKPWDERTESEYYERYVHTCQHWLDAGEGSCLLREPAIAQIVAGALRFFDGTRYRLHCFVIMPNHVHALFQLHPHERLGKIVQSWKSFTAKTIHATLPRSSEGAVWQKDYWDRIIRSPQHFQACADYIRDNPSKAHLPTGSYIYYLATSTNEIPSVPLERGGDILSPKPNNRGRDAHAPFQARGRDAHAPFQTRGRDAHAPFQRNDHDSPFSK